MNEVSLSLEAQAQFRILRSEIHSAHDPIQLRRMALQLVDLMELQRKTVLLMLQENYLKPRPIHPSAFPTDKAG